MDNVIERMYKSVLPPKTYVFYDFIPDDCKSSLAVLMKNGSPIKIEFDYDRVGWSKTGWVYRVIFGERHG